MSLARSLTIALLAAFVSAACGSSTPASSTAAAPPGSAGTPPGAPPAGVTITSGGNTGAMAELTGTAGPRQGNEVVVTTSAAALPRVGVTGVLYWVVDRPIAVFGQGTNLSLADIIVKQVQPGSVTLTIANDSGPITVNGQRINVVQPGIAVKLAYRQ